MQIRINIENCKGCALCIMYCAKGCLRLSPELNRRGSHYAVADASGCNGCGCCYLMCPDVCITLEKPAAGSTP